MMDFLRKRKKNPYPRHLSIRIGISMAIVLIVMQTLVLLVNFLLFSGSYSAAMLLLGDGILNSMEDIADKDALLRSAASGVKTPVYESQKKAFNSLVSHFSLILDGYLILYGDEEEGYYRLMEYSSGEEEEPVFMKKADLVTPEMVDALRDEIRAENEEDEYDTVTVTDSDGLEEILQRPSSFLDNVAMTELTDPEDDQVLLMFVTVKFRDSAEILIIYLCVTAVIMLVASVIIFIVMTLRINRKMAAPLKKIARSASGFVRQTKEDIPPARWEYNGPVVRSKDEMQELADSVENMAGGMKQSVMELLTATREQQRIATEMDLAKRIQSSMLPDVFPPFPERKEFSVFASMTPALDVGGDFYNFFFADEDQLVLVIADVSGKGVPAAIFMATSMNTITSIAAKTLSPAELLMETNRVLSANNRAEMFVTVWAGVLNVRTGVLRAANAGHEYPALRQGGGAFELYRDKHGFVIGEFPDMRYKEYEIRLMKGDTLFVYTDGVPEAQNSSEVMFNTEGMLGALNSCGSSSPEDLVRSVDRAVTAHIGDAPRFDDTTMLCLTWYGEDGDD